MNDRELARLYGPWQRRTVADAAALMSGYGGSWWVAGGWAIEAFTGVSRPHGDLDLGVPRSEAPLLHAHVHGGLDVWQADDGSLRPMADARTLLPDTCENLWLRRSGADRWEYDVILTAVTAGAWHYKRHRDIALPLADALWRREGIAYLRPEIQLLHKAPALRAKDEQDFAACLPLLRGGDRDWLRGSLQVAHPGHPWIARL